MSKEGTIKWYSAVKGFGYIKTSEDEKDDVWVHRSSFVAPTAAPTEGEGEAAANKRARVYVQPGAVVKFNVTTKDERVMAVDVTGEDGQPLPAVRRKKKAAKKPAQENTKATTENAKKPKQEKMTLVLHWDGISYCARRVLLVLAEKQLDYTGKQVNLKAGEHKTPEYLAINPSSKVPVLEIHRNTRTYYLTESVAICRYLATFDSGNNLLPERAWESALMDEVMQIENETIGPAKAALFMEKFFKPAGAKPDTALIEKQREIVKGALGVLENKMRPNGFISGRRYTLADTMLSVAFQTLIDVGCGDLIQSHENLAAWWDKVSQRQTFKDMITKCT